MSRPPALDIDATSPMPERRILQMMQLSASRRFPTYLLEHHEALLRREIDSLTMEFRGQVLADDIGPQNATGLVNVDFFAPANWREHWKRDHVRTWYGRLICWKWPQKALAKVTRTSVAQVDIERYRMFPEASGSYPAHLGREVCVLLARKIEFGDWSEPTVNQERATPR